MAGKAGKKVHDIRPAGNPVQRSSNAVILGIILLFCYLTYTGNNLLEDARKKCARYDEDGGVARRLDCAQAITAYCVGGIAAFGVGLVAHRLLTRR